MFSCPLHNVPLCLCAQCLPTGFHRGSPILARCSLALGRTCGGSGSAPGQDTLRVRAAAPATSPTQARGRRAWINQLHWIRLTRRTYGDWRPAEVGHLPHSSGRLLCVMGTHTSRGFLQLPITGPLHTHDDHWAGGDAVKIWTDSVNVGPLDQFRSDLVRACLWQNIEAAFRWLFRIDIGLVVRYYCCWKTCQISERFGEL